VEWTNAKDTHTQVVPHTQKKQEDEKNTYTFLSNSLSFVVCGGFEKEG